MTTTIRVSEQFEENIRNNSKDGETTAETVDRLYGQKGKTLEQKIQDIAEETIENKGRDIVKEEIEHLQSRY